MQAHSSHPFSSMTRPRGHRDRHWTKGHVRSATHVVCGDPSDIVTLHFCPAGHICNKPHNKSPPVVLHFCWTHLQQTAQQVTSCRVTLLLDTPAAHSLHVVTVHRIQQVASCHVTSLSHWTHLQHTTESTFNRHSKQYPKVIFCPVTPLSCWTHL